MKASRKWLIAKEDQIARELKRLEKLKYGFQYTWPLSTGLRVVRFGGHARAETLDSVWGRKIKERVLIEAESFSERDTVGGSRELRPFNMPANKAIQGIITDDGELRIVTIASSGDVAKVHHRMPSFVDV